MAGGKRPKLPCLADLPGEEWRIWPRSSGLIEVSNLGRARRAVTRSGSGLAGEHYRTEPRNGYPSLGVRLDGRHVYVGIHIAVLETFVGPRPEGYQAAHLNGKPGDPRLENLIWATVKENNGHKYAHGTILFGDRSPTAKLTEADVLAIRRDRAYAEEVAAKYGISKQYVLRIRRRGGWQHIEARSDDVSGHRMGVEHYKATLTEDAVREIRRRVAAGTAQTTVARELGIPRTTLNHIVTRRTWKHVA